MLGILGLDRICRDEVGTVHRPGIHRSGNCSGEQDNNCLVRSGSLLVLDILGLDWFGREEMVAVQQCLNCP